MWWLKFIEVLSIAANKDLVEVEKETVFSGDSSGYPFLIGHLLWDVRGWGKPPRGKYGSGAWGSCGWGD